MSSDPGLQNAKTELDEVEIWRIWRQIPYLTFVWDNEFLDTSVTVYAGVIHDDHTLRGRKGTALRCRKKQMWQHFKHSAEDYIFEADIRALERDLEAGTIDFD